MKPRVAYKVRDNRFKGVAGSRGRHNIQASAWLDRGQLNEDIGHLQICHIDAIAAC